MKLIMYFADGFAWQYLQERPFMEGFWRHRRPLETLLGYSSTIMPAIVTGRPPAENGIWTEYFMEPRPRGRIQRLLTRPRLRRLHTPVNLLRLVWFRFARRFGYSAEHRLRLPVELSHLFSRHPIRYDEFPPIDMPVPTLAEVFAERGLRVSFRFIGEGLDADAELARLEDDLDDTDVFFYYDPSLDHRGHEVGASAEGLAPELDEIERFLSTAWSRVNEGHDAEMLLFSDHGMTNVDGTFDLFERLAPFRLGHDYVVFMDSTFARFWFPDEARRDRVLGALGDVPGHLLTDEDRERYGIEFSDDRYGQEVLVADEGVVFHPNYFAPRFVPRQGYPERAMHGYLPECDSTFGVFFYRGERGPADPPTPFPVTRVFDAVDAIAASPNGR